uniref:Ring finger protein 180b n=1 Tax=Amphiprion percula TaxID=161767 RepID=A0A3P8TXI1_AMPPE
MLRCRKCRKGVIDATCLSTVQESDECSAAVCSIWHVNVDTLPEWILTSVHQAQWTVGKLNCQNCGARLGGFNFINRSECPCGRDAAVHLNKSRVDHDHKHSVLIVQPRRTRPERLQAGGLLTETSPDREERPEFSRTALDSLQLNCAAVTSHISPAEASDPLPDAENTPSFSFSPLYCISHRRRCSVEDDGGGFRSSCFCPAGRPDVSTADLRRSRTDESTRSLLAHPTSQQFVSDGGASLNVVPRRPSACGIPRSPLHQQTEEEATSVQEEIPDSALFLRGQSISDSVAEQAEEEEEVPPTSVGSPASSRLSKREKNRLKSLRRKQRKRERWLHSQLEQSSTTQQRPSFPKSTLPASRTSRTPHVPNGRCPASNNASIHSGDMSVRHRRWQADVFTWFTEASLWRLWASQTCEVGSSTSAWSSSTSTRSTGSWPPSSSVSSCTTFSFEMLQVYLSALSLKRVGIFWCKPWSDTPHLLFLISA